MQSIIFNKKLWTLTESKRFLNRHHLEPIKPVHTTENFYRFGLQNPYPHKRYYTIRITNGVEAIMQS